MKLYRITQAQIKEVIQDQVWQKFRISLKGLKTRDKLDLLEQWYLKGKKAEIQVINYVNALKRAGLYK